MIAGMIGGGMVCEGTVSEGMVSKDNDGGWVEDKNEVVTGSIELRRDQLRRVNLL